MATVEKIRYTPEQFLEREAQTRDKHEFFRGEIFAMAGSSPADARIAMNILWRLAQQLEGKPCQPNSSDVMVKVAATGLMTYPDVSVVCPPIERAEGPIEVLLNPKILVEVLSPSTEKYDRGTKFSHYQKIPSLAEVLLVSQFEAAVDHYVRNSSGSWTFTRYEGLDAELALPSIAARLKLHQVYDRVEFVPSSDQELPESDRGRI